MSRRSGRRVSSMGPACPRLLHSIASGTRTVKLFRQVLGQSPPIILPSLWSLINHSLASNASGLPDALPFILEAS